MDFYNTKQIIPGDGKSKKETNAFIKKIMKHIELIFFIHFYVLQQYCMQVDNAMTITTLFLNTLSSVIQMSANRA